MLNGLERIIQHVCSFVPISLKQWSMLFSVCMCLAASACSPEGTATISERNLQDSLYRMDTLAARVLLEKHFASGEKSAQQDSASLNDSLKSAQDKSTKTPLKIGGSPPSLTRNPRRSTPTPKKDTLRPPALEMNIPDLTPQEADETTEVEKPITPQPQLPPAEEVESVPEKSPAENSPVTPVDTIGG